MNRLFFAMVVAVMGTLTSLVAGEKVIVDHSSKEAIVESFWKATAQRDGEALWEVVLPVKAKTQEVTKTMKQSFVMGYFSEIKPEQCKAIGNLLKGDATRKELISNSLKEMDKFIVKVDGKWYIDIWKMLGKEFGDFKIPACPAQVDHSSKNGLTLSFMLGVYYENDKLVWNCMAPSMRKANPKVPKGLAKMVKESIPSNVLITSIKILSSGEVSMEQKVLPQIQFIKVDGKWYMSPKNN